MLVQPGRPVDYWREAFPYAVIEEFFAPAGWINIELGRRFRKEPGATDTLMERWPRFTHFDGGLNTWHAYLEERAASTTSLHVEPPLSQFLVFDLDLREQPGYNETCGQEHDKRTVCPRCWQVAIRLYDILERAVGQRGPLKLPPPLVVYTGGGGVHYWYKETFQELGDLAARTHVLMSLIVEPILDGIVLDAKVTTVPRHLIRLPFSLHDSTGRVAIPLNEQMLRQPNFAPVPDVSRATAEGAQRLLDWLRA